MTKCGECMFNVSKLLDFDKVFQNCCLKYKIDKLINNIIEANLASNPFGYEPKNIFCFPDEKY